MSRPSASIGARWRVVIGLGLGLGLACDGPPATPPTRSEVEPPVRVEGAEPESELTTLRMSDAAVEKLGIETTTVADGVTPRVRRVVGLVTMPPGSVSSVTAPVAGTVRAGPRAAVPGARVEADQVLLRLVPFAPVDRDLRAQARRQSAVTGARLEVAEARVERLTKLLDNRAASERALEEAKGELATAKAEDAAAHARERSLRRTPMASDTVLDVPAPQRGILRTLAVMPGQSVAGGAALFELMPADGLWVRVPVYPGELDRLASDAPALVARLGAPAASAVPAQPVVAPPSADPLDASVDLYFALPPGADFHRAGERVMVELTYRQERDALVLPASAMVLDFDGGAWVYECLGGGVFRRRRVQVHRRAGETLVLTRGPAKGTCVVSVGAMELLGAEFGVKH